VAPALAVLDHAAALRTALDEPGAVPDFEDVADDLHVEHPAGGDRVGDRKAGCVLRNFDGVGEGSDRRELGEVDRRHAAEFSDIHVLDPEVGARLQFGAGLPVGEGELRGGVAHDALQDLRFAVAPGDGLLVDLQHADLDVAAAVARGDVDEAPVAADLLVDLDRLVGDGNGGGVIEVELRLALPFSDAGVTHRQRVARLEPEVLPRGVGDDAGLVGDLPSRIVRSSP